MVENIVTTVVEQIELLPRKVTNPYAEEPGFEGIGIAFSVFLDDVDTDTLTKGLEDSYVLEMSYVIDFDDSSVMQVGYYKNYMYNITSVHVPTFPTGKHHRCQLFWGQERNRDPLPTCGVR